MELVLAAVIGAISTIVVSAVGVYGAKKAGLGTTQEKLIDNLQDLVASQELSINKLEKEAEKRDARINTLEAEVVSLKELTINQAQTIKQLMSRKKIVYQNSEDI